jgi:2-dehydro-3-deoxyphosphogluconate aldolase/(4S)-4-hydroxy-2-oxoglutarate aldolase
VKTSEIEATREALLADGVVLCVRLGEGAPVLEACRAALEGGLRLLEITLTTPGALDVMEKLASDGSAKVGAGTVLDPEDVRRVADAGARFVLSPVFDPGVVDEAHRLGLLAVPGASTPTEILREHRHGARLVKVFPSGALGGPDYLRAVRGPLPEISLLPTSGPTSESFAAWLDAGAAAVGVGAEVLPARFSLESVEAAARRVRAAFDTARLGTRSAPPGASTDRLAGASDRPGASVRVTPLASGGGRAHGVACAWQGGQYVAIVAPLGLVACGLFDPAVCEHFDFAVALAHGTPEAPLAESTDLLRAHVDSVTPRALTLGLKVGMTGAECLELLLGE